MKITAFEVRDDERRFFLELSKKYNIEIELISDRLTVDTLDKITDSCGITTLGQSKLDRDLLTLLAQKNIQYLATRTIGYNHIDIAAANELGIKVLNANYAPYGVAEYTIMLMLMVLRHYKPALWRGEVYDYSLKGLRGKELRNLTVGIIGTGRIGAAVIKCLTGFGCKILAYNRHPKDEIKQYAQYVDLDTLYRESDIISLHLPLLPATHHIINKDSISKMKDGVILINCARGELMNLDDLIDELEVCKIGGLGLDTVESEEGLVHRDRRTDILNNRRIAYIRQFPNVVMTQHMAFYTDEAVFSMVNCAVEGIISLANTGTYSTLIRVK